MYSEDYKIKNQTIAKISTIFTVPIVIVALQSIVIGVATLLTVGLFLTILKATTYRITVEKDGIYKDIPQIPLTKSRLSNYTDIDSVRPEQHNLMDEQSNKDILNSETKFFGGDIDGVVRIKKQNGEEILLSSETPEKLTSHINEHISEPEQASTNKSTSKTVN